MKLSLSQKLHDLTGTRGIQKFGSILVEELQECFNVKLVKEREKSDIHLSVIHGPRKPGSQNVVRLDGVYYDVGRLKMNNPIRTGILKADGIIYQSKWAKTFVEGMLRVRPKKSTVVYNGAKTQLYDAAEINKFGFDQIMLCCSHWRVNKRLKFIIDSFLECRDRTGINLGLFVVGKPDCSCTDSSVKFFGSVTRKINSLYASADYMCHICHLDACPNSVVEGLCAGLPVLCNNIGGTPELVGSDGVISKLDVPFNFKPVASMKSVAPIDRSILSNGMVELVGKKWNVNRPELDIHTSASGYYDFFKSLLG